MGMVFLSCVIIPIFLFTTGFMGSTATWWLDLRKISSGITLTPSPSSIMDKMGLYPCNGIHVDKSKINLPDTYPLGNCSIVPLMKYELHIRILNLKFFDHLRKPVSRYSRRGNHFRIAGAEIPMS